jgi:tetratricopeptide (TPR) repeat protein
MAHKVWLSVVGLGLMALVAAPTAAAQVTVIGGGLAKDCYEAARFQRATAAEAEKVCTRAIESEAMRLSNRTATYTNRGVLRMRAGKFDASLADYAIAKRLDPSVGAVFLNEGAALIFKKDFTAAKASLDEAIRLQSVDLYAAHYNRGIARENMGDVEGAYFDFQKALELYPDFQLAKQQLTRFSVTKG